MTYDVQSPEAASLWPYLPDWRSGFNVRRSFLTDIKGSRSNTEQRRATRDAPRISVDYRTVLADDELRGAEQFLRSWQNKPTIIPDFARWARLTGSSSGGASTLTIAAPPAWAAEGQNLVLCGDEVEQVLVSGVAGSTVSLADPLINAWATGAVVRPTFFGLFEGRINSSRWTKGAAEIAVTLDCYPGGEPPRDVGTAWATLNDREIFTLEPDYSGAPSLGYIWPVEQVDFDRGRTAQFRPVERAETLRECDFNGLSLATAGETEQFFDRMKGRRGAFYLPSGAKDFTLAAIAASGTSTFLASGTSIASLFGSIDYATVEEAISICLIDGTHLYRRVTDIGASGGNSLVTVDSAWPSDLTTANVARISWMPLVRFASDEMTTNWVTPLSAGTRLTFQSIRA